MNDALQLAGTQNYETILLLELLHSLLSPSYI